jgi:hypothetical protein
VEYVNVLSIFYSNFVAFILFLGHPRKNERFLSVISNKFFNQWGCQIFEFPGKSGDLEN